MIWFFFFLHSGCNKRLSDWAVFEAPFIQRKHSWWYVGVMWLQCCSSEKYVSLQHCTCLSTSLSLPLIHTHTRQTLLYHPHASALPPLLWLLTLDLDLQKHMPWQWRICFPSFTPANPVKAVYWNRAFGTLTLKRRSPMWWMYICQGGFSATDAPGMR